MNICESLWTNSISTISNFKKHNFPNELAKNILELDKFKFYIQQDSIYIREYAEAMKLLSLKAPTAELKEKLAILAQESYELEDIIQQVFFKEFNIEVSDIMQPACLAYTSFLKSTIQSESFIVGLTSLLPCFWVYLENGKYIQSKTIDNNKYQSWIDTYVSQEFIDQTGWIKSLVEEYSTKATQEELTKMYEVFDYSCKLDYQFMDNAYNLRKWS